MPKVSQSKLSVKRYLYKQHPLQAIGVSVGLNLGRDLYITNIARHDPEINGFGNPRFYLNKSTNIILIKTIRVSTLVGTLALEKYLKIIIISHSLFKCVTIIEE